MNNTRKITFEKIQNCRDFRGLTTTDGYYVRSGHMFRSANLSEASESDINRLVRIYHLKKIIDLRTTMEKEQKPDVKIDGVEYIHIPIFDEIKIGISHEKETDTIMNGGQTVEANAKQQLKDNMIPDMEDMYRLVVSDKSCMENISRVLQIILQHDYDSGSILWHCTEGKDRCGMVSAFMLSILSVDKNTILKDYLLTNEVNGPKADMYYQKVLESGKPEAFALAVKNAFLAKEEYFDAAFDVIDKEYGGVAAYIHDGLNIPEEMLEDFRSKVLSRYKYFVTNAEREKSLDIGKTCYFEFQKGYFHDEFWADDSLMLHIDYVDGLGLHACFRDVLSEYDYDDITNVDKRSWKKILDYGMNAGGGLKECLLELESWVDECFKENDYFSIIGM